MMNTSDLHAKWGLFVLAVAMLAACSGGSDGPFSTEDTTAPTVTAAYPADSSSGVVVTTPVKVTFSEAVDETTLDTVSFTLETTTGGVAVSATISYDSGTFVATLSPDSDLSNGTQYTATMTTAVTDVAGNAIASAYSWSFTTASVTVVWEQVGGQVSPATAESEDPTMLVTGTIPSVGYRQGSFGINLNSWNDVSSSWGSTKVHSESGNISGSIYGTPGFASDGTDIFVAYALAGGTYATNAGFYDRIYLDQSTPASAWISWNSGLELSVPWNATDGGSDAYEPAVTVSPGGSPFVAWSESDVAPIPDSDYGAWVASVTSSSSVPSTILSRDDDIVDYSTDVRTVGITADASGNAYLAQWESDATDPDLTNLYVTHYLGGSFTNLGAAVSADYDSNNLSVPSLVLDGADLYIAYTEANAVDYTRHVYVKKYSGGVWSTVGGDPVSAFTPSEHHDSGNPDLLLVNGTLYLAWEESDQDDGPFIFVARWDDVGGVWLMDGDKLNIDQLREAYDPSLAFSSADNTLYVAFEELVSGWTEIFVKRKLLIP